jgi:hypothetical protein
MLNRDIYQMDPLENQLANNGVAVVNDDSSQVALTTLEYELKTFVCDGKYQEGLDAILSSYIAKFKTSAEQPGVWISGFFGSGKSHLAKMLRSLWVNQTFSGGQDARGLADLPQNIRSQLDELSTLGASNSGLHSASGTLGSSSNNSVRLALLGIIFKSVGLPEQYHLARLVIWLKQESVFEQVKEYVNQHAKGKPGEDLWIKELRNLHVSPVLHQAIVECLPSLADDKKEVREIIRAQYHLVKDITNSEMVDGIVDSLAPHGELPLTLVILDEVQQYIGTDPDKPNRVQEAVETCCKDSKLKSKLLFVATGQSALSGMANLQCLMGRFQLPVQLEDTDVDKVIRKVLLFKNETARSEIEAVIQANFGEISRHLHGSTIEHNKDDEENIFKDYPLLPTRRRLWEKLLHALDKTGTGSQLRNQLKIVHEACRESALLEVGHVVPADFIYNQIATSLLTTRVISKDIYQAIGELSGGDEDQQIQSRILSLILLIGKIPSEANLGITATSDSLADLMIADLNGDKGQLRSEIPQQLDALEALGKIMSIKTDTGKEYRLQTAESSQWYDEFNQQQSEFRGNLKRIDTFRAQLIQSHIREKIGYVRLIQGKSTVTRKINTCFDETLPKEAKEQIYASVHTIGSEKEFLDEARGAGVEDATIFIYVPATYKSDLTNAIIVQKAAETTIELRGIAKTEAGKEARSAMEHRLAEAKRKVQAILKHLFSDIQVKQAGGTDIEGDKLTDRVQIAGEISMERLYGEFHIADDKNWDKVYNKARKEGGENALEAIGFNEESTNHPVCSAIKRYIGIGKKGSEIRGEFQISPYGWSQDAIEGALYAMLAAGALTANDSKGQPVDAKNLDRKQLNQTDFKPENVTITKIQLIKVGSLINALGVSCNSGEQQSKLSLAIINAKTLAQKCGGSSPLPASPSTQILDQLLAINGNAQLQLAFENKEKIEADYSDWAQQQELVIQRQGLWSQLSHISELCRELKVYGEIESQQQAIINNRSLLVAPNPIEPLIKMAISALRDTIVYRHGLFEAEYHQCMNDLEQDSSWAQLGSARQQAILLQRSIDKLPKLELGSNDSVLESLNDCSLKQWNDKTSALVGRFDEARKQAVKELEPKIQQVRISKGIIKTEADLKAWLAQVEQEVRSNLEHGPVSPF